MSAIYLPKGRQIGAHLTNNHIRLVEFAGNSQTIVGATTFDLPQQLNELKKNKLLSSLHEGFTTAWRNLKPASGNRDIVLTIGDEEIFIKIISLPVMPLTEAKKAVPHELEPDLPLKADNMYVDIVPLLGTVAAPVADNQSPASQRPNNQSPASQPANDKMELMVFAASKHYIDTLTEVIERAGLRLTAIEISSVSLGRLYARDYNTYLSVDIGSSHGSITIFDNDQIHVSTSVAFSNDAWSAATRGTTERHPTAAPATLTEEQATKSFAGVISDLAEKIQTAIRYYHNRVAQPKKIEQIFLSGSGAQIPHIDNIIADQINLTVTIGHAPITVTADCGTAHLAAIGAALRNTRDEY